jgi:RHS repeat-associated protein
MIKTAFEDIFVPYEPVDSLQYGAWGEPKGGNSAGNASPFGFTGRWGGYTDVRLGMILNWHRWYGPEAGRWGSRDPIGILGGANLYAYVRNTIAVYVDSQGWNFRSLKGRENLDCNELEDEINKRSKELEDRAKELRDNDDVLPWCGPSRTVESYQKEFQKRQDTLRKFMDTHDDKCPKPLPQKVKELAKMPVPVPDPKLDPRTLQNAAKIGFTTALLTGLSSFVSNGGWVVMVAP